MMLPFDRARLRLWQQRVTEAEWVATSRLAPARGFALGLGLSELSRRLAREAANPVLLGGRDDLAAKAKLYAAPLRVLLPC